MEEEPPELSDTPNLGLTYLSASQSQKHVTVNEALVDLDTLTQTNIVDRDLSTPPGSPSEGATYIVGSSGTGAWASQDNNIATYYDSAWRFYTPKTGWLVYVVDEGVHLKYNGTAWVAAFSLAASSWGWQDWNHNGSSQTLTTGGTFYQLENDGAGSYSSTTYKVSGHGNIWDTSSDQFDFSDLSVGDEVTVRLDFEVTTTGANSVISTRLELSIGSSPFYLYLPDQQFKSSGTYNYTVTKPFYIGSTAVRDNPAEVQMSSDNSGDSVLVKGWYVKTQVR